MSASNSLYVESATFSRYFLLLVLYYILSRGQLLSSHPIQEWDLNCEVQMTVFSPAKMSLTKREDTPEFDWAPPKVIGVNALCYVCTLARVCHIRLDFICFSLFRFGLEMNCTYPLSPHSPGWPGSCPLWNWSGIIAILSSLCFCQHRKK